jgi:predicted HTH transcriptional regulator
VYDGDLDSLAAVKYWLREFKRQRADIQNETRPERPLTDVSEQISRLLNNDPFSSTRYLAGQLTMTKEAVKRNLQEVMKFQKFSLK